MAFYIFYEKYVRNLTQILPGRDTLRSFAQKLQKMSKTFVLTDQTVLTTHGFYLDNDGAILDRFRSNPVMLYNHNRENVIGRWVDVRIDGDRMLASPEFDPDDELAAKVAGKVDKGYLRGASLGIYIRQAEYRANAKGEAELHVTSWEVIEASIVAVPSNSGALTLQVMGEDGSELSVEDIAHHVAQLAAVQGDIPKKIDNKMNEIVLTAPALTALGLTSAPKDMAALSEAIVALEAQLQAAKAKTKELEEAAAADLAARVKSLVDSAVKDGRITADRKEQWTKMLSADFASASEALASLPEKKSIVQTLKAVGGGDAKDDRSGWNYMDWAKKDPKGLARLKATDPQAWEALHDSYTRD